MGAGSVNLWAFSPCWCMRESEEEDLAFCQNFFYPERKATKILRLSLLFNILRIPTHVSFPFPPSSSIFLQAPSPREAPTFICHLSRLWVVSSYNLISNVSYFHQVTQGSQHERKPPFCVRGKLHTVNLNKGTDNKTSCAV